MKKNIKKSLKKKNGLPILIQLVKWLYLERSDRGLNSAEFRELTLEIEALKNIIVRANCHLSNSSIFPKQIDKITPLCDFELHRRFNIGTDGELIIPKMMAFKGLLMKLGIRRIRII